MRHKLPLIIVLALLAVACSEPQPTPMYWPTYADFELTARQKFVGTRYEISHKYYAAFAAIYVARECFADNPLTPESFRSFVNQTLWEYADGSRVEAVMAREVVGKMVALGGKDVRGSCIEPYMYPKTAAEASVGQALVMSEMRRVLPGQLGEGLRSRLLARATAEWFQQEARSRAPFVPWIWDRLPLTQIPRSNASVPRGDTLLPSTWAVEYQLSVMLAREASQ